MAPVAAGVAYRQEDRLIGRLGLGQRGGSPKAPLHGVVLMQADIGAGDVVEGGHCSVPIGHAKGDARLHGFCLFWVGVLSPNGSRNKGFGRRNE